jgi:predicted PurR-regulated permease PerM
MQVLVRHRQSLFVAAAALVIVLILTSAGDALPAFGIALAIMFLLDPPITFLHRLGVPRWLGVLLMYVLIGLLVWAIAAFVIRPLSDQFAGFLEKLPALWTAVAAWQVALEQWWAHIPLPPDVIKAVQDLLQSGQQTLVDLIESAIGPLLRVAARTVAFIVGLIVIPVFLFYVLKDRDRFSPALAALLPGSWREDSRAVLAILGSVAGRWIRGQLLLGLAVGTATYVGLQFLALIGFSAFSDFALLLALLAGILEWLPIIGPVLAAIPAVLVGASISPAAALAALGLSVVIQQVENHLLVPKVMGDAVDLHPAVLIFALVVAAALAGVWGAILAAPLTAAARDLYRYTFQRLEGQSPAEALAVALSGVLIAPIPAGPEPTSTGAAPA